LAGIAVRNAERARFLAHEAAAQRDAAEAERDAAENMAYVADMNLIPQSYEQNDFGRIHSLLDESRTSKYRGFEWGYWNRLCHLDLFTLTAHGNGVTAAAFSPNGNRIATGCYDGTVKLWDAETGRETGTLGTPASTTPHPWDRRCIKAVTFSQDGKQIAAVSNDGSEKVWDATDGGTVLTHKLTLKGQNEVVASVAFSPDGTRIATGGNDGTAKLWDAATRRNICTVGVGRTPETEWRGARRNHYCDGILTGR
jgi:WD40 repeat protein